MVTNRSAIKLDSCQQLVIPTSHTDTELLYNEESP